MGWAGHQCPSKALHRLFVVAANSHSCPQGLGLRIATMAVKAAGINPTI